MEIRKSQLRDKLGCWEVIRGFNPLPMASDFPPCEKKHIEKGLHEGIYVGPHCTSEISHTDKVELWKAVHPSQDMANLKYRADTDNDVQWDINYSSMPYGSVRLLRTYLHCQPPRQGLVLRIGAPSKSVEKKQSGAQLIPEVPRIF